MATLQERIIGALQLDPKTYEEVEGDQMATGQAMAVVAAAAVSGGLASIRLGVGVFLFAVIAALVGWVVWAFLTFIIGTKLLPEKDTNADLGQMLRVIGFAAAPGLFGILGIIPFLGWIVRLLLMVWQLAAMVVAVRQGLDYTTTGRAVLVCVIGWIANMIIMAVFGVMFGGMAMMGGAFGR